MGETIQYQGRRISRRTRTALDVIRSLAAVYVVVHHLVINAELTGPLQLIFKWGPEAVIVFFLLSGFVIFHNEKNRVHGDLSGYYLRRLRRIYPPLIIAFALSAVLASVGGWLSNGFDLRSLILNALSLQDLGNFKPGSIVDPFLGNGPLWSLSYEVLFYLVFPLIMVAYRRSRLLALSMVGAASILGFATYAIAPNHFSLVLGYLLIWWAGAVIAELYAADRLTIAALLPVAGWLSALCLVAGVSLFLSERGDMTAILKLSLILFAFGLGCVLLAGTGAARLFARVVAPLSVSAAYVASISYGLYVFHYPLLIQWDFAQTPVGFVLAVVILVGLSILGDRYLAQVLPKPMNRKPLPAEPKVPARA